jgi:signal transduction histidine kinase
MLLMGAALSVPATVLKQLGSEGGWWKVAWVVGFVLVVLWIAAKRSSPQRWKVIVPAVVGVALAPLSCAMEQVGLVDVATLFLVPIVLAVLFMDAFDVVVAVSVVGWVANSLFFAWLGWPPDDVASASGLFGGVLAAVVMAAAGARKLRELDRETETQHSQALRLSESRRAQAERLAIVGRLASGVAHEINNPLAFVKANVGALRRSLLQGDDPLSEDELEEILGDTTQGIDRICQIVADLKGFSREDSGVVEPVDVLEAVTGAVRLATVRLPRDVKVTIEVPNGLPPVRASQRKLAQVLLNLLVNAGEALEEMRVLKPTVLIRAVPEGDNLLLSITDNGPGIPPDVMARLFEPFFTTKPPGKGTGLGLALSREYVEAFGGTLSAHNVEPRGAQFCITVKATAITGETPAPGSLNLGPERALLVARHRRRTA